MGRFMQAMAGGLMLAAALAAPAAGRAVPALSPAARLGKALFYDPGLSASGRQSCASCHDPSNHFAPANDKAVQRGGARLDRPGIRAVPTLTYKDEAPEFSTQLENPDGSNSGPGGGHDWDGRMPSIAAQSVAPLITSFEMANPDKGAAVARIMRRGEYVRAFRAIFGDDVLSSVDRAFRAMGTALAAYQHEDPAFHPYSSKYDYYTRGLAALTPQEARGMALFNDADRANCASCHTAGEGPGKDGSTSVAQFTDFFFKDIGVPANRSVTYPAAGSYDMGLCGPARTDLTNRHYCGLFMAPTLRNVATRKVFFHNGSLRSLRDVVEFYVTRDITPERWYHRDAAPLPYDGLPPDLRTQVDREDMPFAGQGPNARPILNEQEVTDLVAFLETLTDGYDPAASKAK
ncbi:cytochrome c peroxidase [Gluconacetobacter johannae DSM 13595]|uniref:C-type cytochrome n=1 Tax=Gluconacetobacter johannae TaxID=112140 RepID=A0A7W4P7R8_9PROT|nr:cytochrome c peroxidase [Gluconacetobacter johannae]MBB2177225.1 c-type cytochrome [Gluconacetobacter johannae]GBQ81832.1 cytochrome c peroxidase [Gluconacetobacter johannae DSM 13595]